MGKKSSRGRRGGLRTTRRRPDWQNSSASNRDESNELPLTNESFEAYYKTQKILPEKEWEQFVTALRTDLPITFRFVSGCRESARLVEHFQQNIAVALTDCRNEGGDEVIVKTLHWYPSQLAFQVNMRRKSVRRHAGMQRLHKFLIAETACGVISRQEAVSMIPPLFMDIKPHHTVFDMCAAPGSKTAQIIEMLHAGGEPLVPDGLVIANDVDNRRSYMLVHQTLKRFGSPCCIVTNMDAKVMPNMKMLDMNGSLVTMKFDRILCDVPCSGDGTLRKNVGLWKTWRLSHAFSLHRLQFKIAQRGVQLLKPGGRLVYSTCSLNPIENEAVICALLQHFNGALQVLDMSNAMPELLRNKGLRSWMVVDDGGKVYEDFSEVPEPMKRKFAVTMFPPNDETSEKLHLDRCMRFLPHHQDTGAFFVAVLKKSSDDDSLPVQRCATEEPTLEVPRENVTIDEPTKRPRFGANHEDPFVFLDVTDPIVQSIKSHFDFDNAFDQFSLLVRSKGDCKKANIYMVNGLVKNFIVNNENNVKIVNAGHRIFGRNSAKLDECNFRLAQEGLEILYPLLGKRVVRIPSSDALQLLKHSTSCLFAALSEESQQLLSLLSEGSVALCCSHDGVEIRLAGWRGKASLALHVDKETKMHYLHLMNHWECDDTATEHDGEQSEQLVSTDNQQPPPTLERC